MTVESVFISRFTMNNIAPKLQKCRTHKIAFKIVLKILKQPNFFHSQPSTHPKEALAKFYLSRTFGLRFITSSVAPTRSSTFYAYLITKIGNCNLNFLLHFSLCRSDNIWITLLFTTSNQMFRTILHTGVMIV